MRHTGAIEEIADKKFNGDILNSVVIPLMANDRFAACGRVDPNEIGKGQIFITTAGNKQQFAYEKLTETYQEMIDGKPAFVIGNSYELPCMYKQLDIGFVEELKSSPTYSIQDFMREYESIWTGSSKDALVSEEKLNKCRKVKIAEWESEKDKNGNKLDKIEYVLAYDVSRSMGQENALSCLTVFKLTPRSDGSFVKELVNIFSREGEHYQDQAKFLKEKVREFDASILIVDANGIGSAVVDQLVLDLDDGNPPYSVVNDSDYDRYMTNDSIPMVYALKAQSKETKQSDMINNLMQVFNKLDVGLLVTPDAGVKALQKKYKLKMDSEDIYKYEIPYLLTNSLVDETLNQQYKQTGNVSKTERISKRLPQDKFSSLMYGLYWIYLYEKKNKSSNIDAGEYDFVFDFS